MKQKIQELIDVLITPEFGETESRALTELVGMVANDPEKADEINRYAFTKTLSFEESFKEFCAGKQTAADANDLLTFTKPKLSEEKKSAIALNAIERLEKLKDKSLVINIEKEQ